MKYFAKFGFGLCGCDGSDVFEASSIKEAEEYVRTAAIQQAESFGYYQYPDLAGGCLDEVFSESEVSEWEEAGRIEEDLPCGHSLHYYYVEYDPEVHDDLI